MIACPNHNKIDMDVTDDADKIERLPAVHIGFADGQKAGICSTVRE